MAEFSVFGCALADNENQHKLVLTTTRKQSECHHSNPYHCPSMFICFNKLKMLNTYPEVYAIKNSVQRHPIFISVADHDYILDEIEYQYQNEYKRKLYNVK